MTEEVVQLKLFHSSSEAEIARSLLECEGIPVMIASDDAGGTEPQFQFTRGVRLMVRGSDLKQAQELLETEPQESGESGEEEDEP